MSAQEAIPSVGNAEVDPRAGQDSFLRRWRLPLMIVGPLLIVAVIAWFVVAGRAYETTDNAYVEIAKVPVAPQVGGRVTDVYVHENQRVTRGQVLFRLDARDYQAAAQAAAAQAAGAELTLRSQRAAYQQQLAMVQAARETLAYTTREAARQQQLAAAGVASRQEVDQAVHAAQQARQDLAAAQQQASQALASLDGNPNLAPAAAPAVMQARAELARARLNVAYATVVAPADGVVTRVEQMPVGSYLNASQPAFWLVAGSPWVTANFLENQLARMKVGQPVAIKVDAYPGARLTGHVASFSPGAGAAFSPLPAQNATGNWVKVVQRLPVRIVFDQPPPGMATRAGLSANVKVDVRAPGHAG